MPLLTLAYKQFAFPCRLFTTFMGYFYIAMQKFLYSVVFILLLCTQLLSTTGCKKEYSFEGAAIDTTTIPTDTIPLPVDSTTSMDYKFPFCDSCKNMEGYNLWKWNYKTGNSFLCGNITAAVISPDRDAFTFFGPSACSLDTGVIFTVYLDDIKLNKDLSDITISKVLFYYYDNVSRNDIFTAEKYMMMTLTIDSYDYATGIAKGRFYGAADRKDAAIALIEDGKYEVQFK